MKEPGPSRTIQGHLCPRGFIGSLPHLSQGSFGVLEIFAVLGTAFFLDGCCWMLRTQLRGRSGVVAEERPHAAGDELVEP